MALKALFDLPPPYPTLMKEPNTAYLLTNEHKT
jgi:hypothetical protein